MTIQGALGLIVKGGPKGGPKQVSAKLKCLWMQKSILFIDEISMVSYNMLVEIENQCRVLKDNNITWGGLRVVLFCRDFY